MKIGPYTVLREIGTGTFATVSLAVDKKGAKYAIKQLHPLLKDTKSISILQRELKINRHMFSRHIVQVQDYKEYKVNGNITRCLIMEYIDGIDLGQHIKQNGKLSPKEVLNISWQVCQGLVETHEKKVYHLDLKPQNILINKSGIAKITDFGLAVAFGLSVPTLSKIGGTPVYIPPEVWENNEGDGRSDLYSLGIVMYEMLLGAPPFQGVNHSLMRQHVESNPIFIRDIRKEIPQRLAVLIHKLLEKDPKHRFQTAKELLSALEILSEDEGIDLKNLRDQSSQVRIRLSVGQKFRSLIDELFLIASTNFIFWLVTFLLTGSLAWLGFSTSLAGPNNPSATVSQTITDDSKRTITAVIDQASSGFAEIAVTGTASIPEAPLVTARPSLTTIRTIGPSPSSTLAPAVVNIDSLRMRFGPSTIFSTITSYPRTYGVEILGRTEDNSWLFVRTADGNQGWMFAENLQINTDLNNIPVKLSPATPTPAPQPTPRPQPTAAPQLTPRPQPTAAPQPTTAPTINVSGLYQGAISPGGSIRINVEGRTLTGVYFEYNDNSAPSLEGNCNGTTPVSGYFSRIIDLKIPIQNDNSFSSSTINVTQGDVVRQFRISGGVNSNGTAAGQLVEIFPNYPVASCTQRSEFTWNANK